MKRLDSKKLRLIRNLLIIGGILVGFIIWLFAPSVLNGHGLFNLGNSEYGSKLFMIPTLILPLFALFGTRQRPDVSLVDESERARIIEENTKSALRDQIAYAIIEDVIVIIFMVVALFL